MPRKPRIHIPGAFYHVMIRGNKGIPIFFNDKDRNYFLKLLKQSTKKFDNRIHCYCLMTNHVHLIIQAGNISLSIVMHNITSRYAKWINHQDEKIGHVFQGRYQAILAQDDTYLMELVRYIHQNPLKAHMVADINTYPWTSHFAYSAVKTYSWLTTDFILCLFGETRGEAIRNYQNLLAIPLDKVNATSALKNDLYKEELQEDNYLKYIEETSTLRIHEIDQIIKFTCNKYKIDINSITELGKDKHIAMIRVIIIRLIKESGLITTKELSKIFHRDPSTINSLLKRNIDNPIIEREVECLRKEIKFTPGTSRE